MRSTSVVLVLASFALFAASSANATALSTSALSLKGNMKQIKHLFKRVVAAVNDPSKNTQSAADAASLVALFSTVEDQVPDTISSLPAAEQPAALADYKSLIQKEVEAATALEHAFESGDNAAAALILKEMDDVRRDGHEKYSD
jgi:hypothetical protein